jgi:hypothetical protein
MSVGGLLASFLLAGLCGLAVHYAAYGAAVTLALFVFVIGMAELMDVLGDAR